MPTDSAYASFCILIILRAFVAIFLHYVNC